MPAEDGPTTPPPALPDRPPAPASRRSRRHWDRVAAYRAKCQADVDALLPETWEGQVRKPVESLQAGGEGEVAADNTDATDPADATKTDADAGWCVVM